MTKGFDKEKVTFGKGQTLQSPYGASANFAVGKFVGGLPPSPLLRGAKQKDELQFIETCKVIAFRYEKEI